MLCFHFKPSERACKTQPTQSENSLHQAICATKNALDAAYSKFDNVTDPDLIDSTIYELNAVQQRYKYLLRQVKG